VDGWIQQSKTTRFFLLASLQHGTDQLQIDTLVESVLTRAGNEPNQPEYSSKLDSTIDSLNLVHEPNEPNLSWKLSSSIK
jgi:hypothetical protein